MSAISAAAMRVRTMADGSLRIEVEVEPQDAQQAFALFGRPGAPMALAALVEGHAAVKEPAPEKPKGGERAKCAGMLCNDPAFQFWLSKTFSEQWEAQPGQTRAEVTANVVRSVCGVQSRVDFDGDSDAWNTFETVFRRPWLAHNGVTA